MSKKELKLDSPYLLEGEKIVEDRGSISFVNEFDFPKVKRFYVITSKKGVVRAWHGHKHEAKYVFAISGSALVGAVRIDNWKHPSKNAKLCSFLLSSQKPAILFIPKGYANGFKSLTDDAKLMFFSTKTLLESKRDDIRFDSKYWDI